MKIEIPEKLEFLFDDKSRYLIAYGGRGAGKSYSIAAMLLVRGMQKPLRILCAREIQNSIKQSVYQLLVDLISKHELHNFYNIQSSQILGKNGTKIVFEGLRHNIASIKSMEAIDICWIEEAHVVSKASWDTLVPTIRSKRSQIIISMNPELEEDETYQRFIVNTPSNAIREKVNYSDNPWFPDVLEQERLYLKEKDPQAYDNVWEGNCKAAIEGAIYSKELERATLEGRITKVPYDTVKPVDLFFDLGYSDQTAIWFGQMIGMEHHFIRYYANSGEKINHYIHYLKSLEYVYGNIFLPHDANNEQLGQEKSVLQQINAAFPSCNVVMVPRCAKKSHSVEAGRSIFPNCYFDKELCADGISCLRRYRYKVDLESGRISREPEHDMYSHGADAFQCAGMAMRGNPIQKRLKPKNVIRRAGITV